MGKRVWHVNENIVTKFKSDERLKAIFHCVNCQGKMGTGVAKDIRNGISGVYKEYLEHLKAGKDIVFGTCRGVKYNDRHVINLFGQYWYSRNSRQVNYGALTNAIVQSLRYLEENNVEKDSFIGFPYKMACNNAGGDWEIVSEIIEFFFKNYRIVYFFK